MQILDVDKKDRKKKNTLLMSYDVGNCVVENFF